MPKVGILRIQAAGGGRYPLGGIPGNEESYGVPLPLTEIN